MEDLRSGKLAASLSRPASRRGKTPGRDAALRAVVTGGAKGIGLEIASALRNAGASVDIIDCDEKRGREAAQRHGLRFHPLDIADSEAFEKCLLGIIADRGDIDIMVNNAAEVDFRPLAENTVARMLRSMQVNLLPAFVGAKVILERRRALSEPNPYGGRIINICSTRAIMSEAGTECYSASKGALLSLTHALMMSLSEAGITVNAISPGWIETDADACHSEADRLQHPSRRVGKPADVARMCVFLCEGGNDFINGENLVIDGGMTRRMIYVD